LSAIVAQEAEGQQQRVLVSAGRHGRQRRQQSSSRGEPSDGTEPRPADPDSGGARWTGLPRGVVSGAADSQPATCTTRERGLLSVRLSKFYKPSSRTSASERCRQRRTRRSTPPPPGPHTQEVHTHRSPRTPEGRGNPATGRRARTSFDPEVHLSGRGSADDADNNRWTCIPAAQANP
jgi:hypothetical protein